MPTKGGDVTWVPRERATTARKACPWLIRKFIDPEAELLYVSADKELSVAEREGAHPYDARAARHTHRDELCSLEVLEFGLSVPVYGVLSAWSRNGVESAETA